MGFLSDRFEPIIPMVGSTLYSSAVVLFAWRSSESFTSLLIFCLLYGLFAGGYSVLYCRFVTALTDRPDAGLWLYSIFEFQRGIGNLIGGSVSGILMTEVYTVQKYENLILFIGIAFSVSSVGGMSYWGLRWYLEFLNHVLEWCW
jgi:sugar phosphate permease